MLLSGVRRVARMIDGGIWDGIFLGRFEQQRFAIRVFERHVEEVK